MTAAAGLSRTFWSGRRVFVTGHTGFKGGWLMGLLQRLGAEPHGYALAPPSEPNVFTAADVARFGSSTLGDIRDGARLQAAISEAAPEIVLHLAAQALVRPARADPIETFSTNVVGTAQVLEAVRNAPSVTACVVVTSDKVYDNVEWSWAYRETDRLGGKEPYGASKACTELVVESYRASYFSGDGHKALLASARAGNVIGGGDWAEDRLIPDAVRACSAGNPLMIRNPSSVRPWQHVLEPLSGYLRLAEALATGTALPPPSPSISGRRPTMPCRCAQSSTRSPPAGRMARAGATTRVSSPTKHGFSRSIAPRRERFSAGSRAGGLIRRSTAPSTGTRPTTRAKTCTISRCGKSMSISMADVTRTLPCRACGTPLTHVFVDLGMSPVSNAMRKPSEAHEAEAFYPLRTFVCEQLQAGADRRCAARRDAFPRLLHLLLVLFVVVARACAPLRGDDDGAVRAFRDVQVVEVASNDGYLLQYFKAQGIPVLGIDPAANCAEVAERERGVPTLVRFFGVETAREVAAQDGGRGQADVIAGNNVLAHVPDLNDFVGGLKVLLKESGVITIEFPHLLGLIEGKYFDTIYHEHYSYLSLLAVERLFAHHALTIFDVEELPTHGGSLRIFAGHAGKTPDASERLIAWRAKEAAAGLDGLDIYTAFAAEVRHAKRALLGPAHRAQGARCEHRRVWRGREGQYAAQLLRTSWRLHRLCRRLEPAQARAAAARHCDPRLRARPHLRDHA